MGFSDRMKQILKKKEVDKIVKEEIAQEKYQVVLNNIDRCALYLKNKDRYIFIKDSNFPFMLNEVDLEFIEMNQENFEYYEEFTSFEFMTEKILELERKESINKKTEKSYLIDYLEHSGNNYQKIVEKMKTFEIDKVQYDKLINKIKQNINEQIKYLYENYENSNPNLETDRSYKEIMDNLIEINEFAKKYPYNYYEEIRHKDTNGISHCGYPDYMWQSGAERNIYTFNTNSK